MKLSILYLPLFLILFLVTGYTAVAQDDATTKFLDSLKTAQTHDSAMGKVDTVVAGDESTDDSTTADILPDTAIISNQRKINADTLHRIKKDKGFYYQRWLDSLLRSEEANMKKERKTRDVDLSALNGIFTIFKILLWLLAAAVLVFIIYKLFLGKNALFLRNRKNIDAVMAVDEQTSATEYQQLIKNAELEKNYRLAVRYRYLQAISDLSEKEFIRPGADKTNYQYISELKKHAVRAGTLFASLTVKYEYSWYGEYAVSEDLYAVLQRNFADFYKELA